MFKKINYIEQLNITQRLILYNFTLTQLLIYGVHLGHNLKKTPFYSAWIIFSYTQELALLNLIKTLYIIRTGLRVIDFVSWRGGPIWFINLDQAAGIITRTFAKSCGEFACTSFWIYGLISNYGSVCRNFMKLKKYLSFSFKKRNVNAEELYKNWYFTRVSWPRAIFISSVRSSYPPAKESALLGIPCLGIVDSDAYTHVVNIPIPGNDDSLDCLAFYNDFVARVIMTKKLGNIIAWYLNVRHSKRLLTFKSWIKKKLKEGNKIKLKRNLIWSIKFRFNLLKNIEHGMTIFFTNNSQYLKHSYNEKMEILNKDKKKNQSESELNLFAKKMLRFFFTSRSQWLNVCNFSGISTKWDVNYYIRHRFFTNKYLRTKLLTHNYFMTNIMTRRFYRTHLRWESIRFNFASRCLKFFLLSNYIRYLKFSKFPYVNSSNPYGKIYFKYIAENLAYKTTVPVKKMDYKKNKSIFFWKNELNDQWLWKYRTIYLLGQGLFYHKYVAKRWLDSCKLNFLGKKKEDKLLKEKEILDREKKKYLKYIKFLKMQLLSFIKEKEEHKNFFNRFKISLERNIISLRRIEILLKQNDISLRKIKKFLNKDKILWLRKKEKALIKNNIFLNKNIKSLRKNTKFLNKNKNKKIYNNNKFKNDFRFMLGWITFTKPFFYKLWYFQKDLFVFPNFIYYSNNNIFWKAFFLYNRDIPKIEEFKTEKKNSFEIMTELKDGKLYHKNKYKNYIPDIDRWYPWKKWRNHSLRESWIDWVRKIEFVKTLKSLTKKGNKIKLLNMYRLYKIDSPFNKFIIKYSYAPNIKSMTNLSSFLKHYKIIFKNSKEIINLKHKHYINLTQFFQTYGYIWQ